MKKLNLILKLVVLSVFAGGLGLAGNGLNCEVCAMENATHEDLEESLNNLQKEIENAGFPARYEDLRGRFDNGALLNDGERETAVEQCNTILKEIENYLNEYDNLGKDMEQFCNTVPDRYYAVGNHLREIRSKFDELREALSDKVGNPSEKPKETGSSSLPHIIGNLSEEPKETGSILLTHINSLPNNAEKSFENLKSKIESLNFSEKYRKLLSNVELIKGAEKATDKTFLPNLQANLKESDLRRCRRVLDAIERFKSELDNIKIGPLGGSKSEEISVIEKDLKDRRDAFIKIYDDLSKKDWVPEKNKTIETVELELEVPSENKIDEIFDNIVYEIKLKNENDEKNKEVKNKEAKNKEAKNKEAKNKEAKNKKAKNKKAKNKKVKNREVKNKKAKNKEAKNKEVKNKEVKNKEEKNKEEKNKEAKNREVKNKEEKNKEAIEGLERFFREVDSSVNSINSIISFLQNLANFVPENSNFEDAEAFIETYEKYLTSNEYLFNRLNVFYFDKDYLNKSFDGLIKNIDEEQLDFDQKSRIEKIKIDFSNKIKVLDERSKDLHKASDVFCEKVEELYAELYKKFYENTLYGNIEILFGKIKKLDEKLGENTFGKHLNKRMLNAGNGIIISLLDKLFTDAYFSTECLESLISTLNELEIYVPENSNFENVKAFVEKYDKLIYGESAFENFDVFNFDKDYLNECFDGLVKNIDEKQLNTDQKRIVERIRTKFSDNIKILGERNKEAYEAYDKFSKKMKKLYPELFEDVLDDKIENLFKKIKGLVREIDKKILVKVPYEEILGEEYKEAAKKLDEFMHKLDSYIECLESTISFYDNLVASIPENPDPKNLEGFIKKYGEYVNSGLIERSNVLCSETRCLNSRYNNIINSIDEEKLNADQKKIFDKIGIDISKKSKNLFKANEESSKKCEVFSEELKKLKEKLRRCTSDKKIKDLYEKIEKLDQKHKELCEKSVSDIPATNEEIIENLEKFLIKMDSSVGYLTSMISFLQDLNNSISEEPLPEDVKAFIGKYSDFVNTRDESLFNRLKKFCYNIQILNGFFDDSIKKIDKEQLNSDQKSGIEKIKSDFSKKIKTLDKKIHCLNSVYKEFCNKVSYLLEYLDYVYKGLEAEPNKELMLLLIKSLDEKIRKLGEDLKRKMEECIGELVLKEDTITEKRVMLKSHARS